jgi:two-component system phosphate regulon sensor histidine kinase PhoR
MNKQHWLAILMGITILGITGFQGYWLKNNYERERQNLEIRAGSGFHQTVLRLQASKLNLEKLSIQLDSLPGAGTIKTNAVLHQGKKHNMPDSVSGFKKIPPISIVNLLQEKFAETAGDSGKGRAYIFSGKDGFIKRMVNDSIASFHREQFNAKVETISISTDSVHGRDILKDIHRAKEANPGKVLTVTYKPKKSDKEAGDSVILKPEAVFIEKNDVPRGEDEIFERGMPFDGKRKNTVFRFLYNIDSVSMKDSVTIQEVTKAYTEKLKAEKMNGLSFTVTRLDSSIDNSSDPYSATVGFVQPVTYHLSIENKLSYLLKKLVLPILFSLLLVGITVVSFVLLYRNLLRQRRLAELKNEFISNVTHELKTPIATVGVAIEALKNFNAMNDPERTREYLDISQNELQRLSLLVDKVLKLSMFEKKEMELKKEQFDCRLLVEEVMNSMKLQFDKYRAKIKLFTEGENFIVEADKLHITSVIYNLLDNALKYSRENPMIDVRLKSFPEYLEFSVSDNGIGIAPAYKQKVFDKFFRVPTGDKHNIKGYGLGLSYVSEVLRRHQGHISVESEPGKGSTFTTKLPYA